MICYFELNISYKYAVPGRLIALKDRAIQVLLLWHFVRLTVNPFQILMLGIILIVVEPAIHVCAYKRLIIEKFYHIIPFKAKINIVCQIISQI